MKIICSLLLLLFSAVASNKYGDGPAACSPSTLLGSLKSSDLSLLVYINKEEKGNDPSAEFFRATVRRVYNGCGVERKQKIFVKSSTADFLNLHAKYVLFGFVTVEHIYGYHQQQLVLNIGACEANTPFHKLSWAEQRQLRRFPTKMDCDGYVDPTTAMAPGVGNRFFGDSNGVPVIGGPVGGGTTGTGTGYGYYSNSWGNLMNNRVFGGSTTTTTTPPPNGPGGGDSFYDAASSATGFGESRISPAASSGDNRIFGGSNSVPIFEGGGGGGSEPSNPGPNPGPGGGGGATEYDPVYYTPDSKPAYATTDSYVSGDNAAPADPYVDPYRSYTSCTKNDCPPLPYDSQTTLCPDGETTSGITGTCVLNPTTYQCEWEIQTCPTCTIDSTCRHDQICENGFCAPAECSANDGGGGACHHDQFCEAGRCKTCYCDAGTPLSLCPDQLTMGSGHGDACVYVNGSCKREYIDCPTCDENDFLSSCQEGQICVDGFCAPAECSASEQCAADEVCTNGRCETCQCGGGDDRTPYDCHDLSGKQGNVAGACLREPSTGQCAHVYSACEKCDSDAYCHRLDKGYCDAKDGQCKSAQCFEDNQCDDNEVCDGYSCVPCQCQHDPLLEKRLCHDQLLWENEPLDCYRANNGQCVYDYSQCEACGSNDDCYQLGADGVCIEGECRNAQCMSDTECAYNEVCEGYECLPCYCEQDLGREKRQCHDQLLWENEPGECYRAANGQCVLEYSECKQCGSNDDCYKLGADGICIDGECRNAQCMVDTDCAYNEVCDGYECLPCYCEEDPSRQKELCHDLEFWKNVPGECYRAPNGQCALEYSECKPCDIDQDCFKLDKGICSAGRCESAQCLVDMECGHDELCFENRCVQCDCGPPTKQERKCHDNKNIGNIPGPCLREKGQCVQEYSTCSACRSDSDCSEVFNGVCRDGTCESAECLSDSQCNDYQVCDAGYCVACDCGNPQGGETACFDGSVAGPDECKRSFDHGVCSWTYSECPLCGIDFACPNGFDCLYGECIKAKVANTCKTSYECPYNHDCVYGKCKEKAGYY